MTYCLLSCTDLQYTDWHALSLLGYAAQEFVSGIPVVQQTPFFFGDPIV